MRAFWISVVVSLLLISTADAKGNKKKQRLLRHCSKQKDCSLVGQVCGSNGKIYRHECHFKFAQCKAKLLKKPAPTRESCKMKKKKLKKFPICGSDGKTYRLKKAFRKARKHARKHAKGMLKVKHVGECRPSIKKKKKHRKCKKGKCRKVCSNDGVVYKNLRSFLKAKKGKEQLARGRFSF